ncbi:MAG: ArsR/SmtB family transcription factor [Nitrososphaerales archaeon]
MEKAKNYSIVTTICKVLSNRNRLRIIMCLEKKSYSFGELLKELAINPKVLNDHLNVLIANKLVAKSYPYNVYALTPAGHLVKQGLDAFNGYITRIANVLKEGQK